MQKRVLIISGSPRKNEIHNYYVKDFRKGQKHPDIMLI